MQSYNKGDVPFGASPSFFIFYRYFTQAFFATLQNRDILELSYRVKGEKEE